MTTNKNIVDIHGKAYMTVAGRVEEAHKQCKAIDITSEVLNNNPVVIKATVKTEKGTFTGISAANPTKMIEKMSPYEVAETSAVGRALGFAGFGIVEGIATADEMNKASYSQNLPPKTAVNAKPISTPTPNQEAPKICSVCGGKMSLSKAGHLYCYPCYIAKKKAEDTRVDIN